MIFFKKIKQEESKRFNSSPYSYAISLFLMLFGLTVCTWTIGEVLFITKTTPSYSMASIISLIISLLILITLDNEASKAD
ncbi:hypothetical protein RI844_09090 [Thalassotalea fonticola]|uniref:YiaAB two helix domain-containing protein n=1 Tax=Thalassotalea fonticola TaxID=3065649 RepID=A0ABZ0GU69_9GAMM|nr:hypothetical protein RI844_09090 [Colwelliaceae bacterium S1-1]